MAIHRAAVLVLTIFLLSQSANSADRSVPPGVPVYFVTVKAPEDVKFAREHLIKYLGVVGPAEWDRVLGSGQVKIARADLNDDGSQEVFIMAENSLWCGSIGCTGILLQKRRDCWDIMDKPNFPGDRVVVLQEKRFGYHKIFTGDDIYIFRNGKTYEILSLEDGHVTR